MKATLNYNKKVFTKNSLRPEHKEKLVKKGKLHDSSKDNKYREPLEALSSEKVIKKIGKINFKTCSGILIKLARTS